MTIKLALSNYVVSCIMTHQGRSHLMLVLEYLSGHVLGSVRDRSVFCMAGKCIATFVSTKHVGWPSADIATAKQYKKGWTLIRSVTGAHSYPQ